jgi:hypothetical protein
MMADYHMTANPAGGGDPLSARVNLTCKGEHFAYTIPLARALRVVIEEWSGIRQANALISYPGGDYPDLGIQQIRSLYNAIDGRDE